MRRRHVAPAYLLAVFLFLLCIFTPLKNTASALTKAQRRVLNSGVYYFNTEESGGSCGGAATLAGSDNQEKTWNYLISKGLTAIQAAGAMGNLQHEGNFNPKRVEVGHMEGNRWLNSLPAQFPAEMETIPPHNLAPIVSGRYAGQPGYGIVQWTSPGRKDGLQSFANQKNLPVHDLALQLDYMWSELEGPYKQRALDPLMATDDLATAVSIWQDHYEVGRNFQPRFDAAKDWLTKFGSGTGTATSGSGSVTCGNSGQLAGGLSLPVDRHWYDEHPAWFTKTHHDYPASDIPVPTGSPIYAIAAGKIDRVSGASSDCGMGMTIDSGNGIRINYCHSSDAGTIPGAKLGDTVTAGQLIMNSNDTGNSTGPHLHVGIFIDGGQVCPQTLFVGIADGAPPDITSLPSSGCTH